MTGRGRAAIDIAVGLVLTAAVARASPPWPLEGLLQRAETVFIGRRLPGEFLVFQPTRMLRSGVKIPKSFRLGGWHTALPPGDYLVFSQGDPDFGPPTDEIESDQGIEGQGGYCGWIALSLERDAHGRFTIYGMSEKAVPQSQRLDLDALVALVKRSPYDPTKL